MKKIYESFTEIAEDFTRGESWAHSFSDHTPDDCFAWQHGVREFAKFLDEYGLKMTENTEIYEKLWDEIRTHKPDGLTLCEKCSSDG